jgi:hypothetical protein
MLRSDSGLDTIRLLVLLLGLFVGGCMDQKLDRAVMSTTVTNDDTDADSDVHVWDLYAPGGPTEVFFDRVNAGETTQPFTIRVDAGGHGSVNWRSVRVDHSRCGQNDSPVDVPPTTSIRVSTFSGNCDAK